MFPQHQVVSKAQRIEARKKLLAKENQFTRRRHELSRGRRELRWQKVDKQYVFEGPDGRQNLPQLFDGRSQLIVYRFMFGPEWNEGCPSCSFNMDHTDGALVHLAQRDASFAGIHYQSLSHSWRSAFDE